jgi:hypothetical protein
VELEAQEGGEGASCGSPPISRTNWLNIGAYVINTVVTYVSIAGVFGETNSDLSKKYQTLVTPAGWAFSIWGIIFIWEGVFVVAQLLPQFRQSKVVEVMSPWWWSLCTCQMAWTFAFAQDVVTLALIFMLCILGSLLGLSWKTDGMAMTTAEYFVLRAPLSLQLGWIIAASVVNVSVEADAKKSSPEVLLGLAIVSNAAVLAVVTAFTFAVKSPDPFVGLVAAWAFTGIRSELGTPTNLNDPSRFNPSIWDPLILSGLRGAALGIVVISLAFAATSVGFRVLAASRTDAEAKTES